MSIRNMAALAALVLLPLAAGAAETEHPYKNAKKGEWMEYKATVSAMGQEFTMNVKQTVVEATEKEVKVEITGSFNGIDIPKQTQTIDLTKPFNPLAAANIPGGGNPPKIEKKDSGKEKIKVGGKEYDTEWTSYKVNADVNGVKLEADLKNWIAKGIGLGGLVKQEMKSDQFTMTMELEKSGKD